MAIIASQSFELEPAPGGQYIDTGEASVDHDLVNNPNQPIIDSTAASAGTLGFDASYQNTRNSIGLTDGDFAGVTNFTGQVGSFTNGSQGYQFNDTDGRHTLTFDSVDISNFQNVTVSLDYFINSTTWESNDVITIIVNTDVGSFEILDTTESDVDDLNIEGAFTTGIANIPDAATTAQLIVSLDSNANDENLYIDNLLVEGDEITGGDAFDLQITEIWSGQTGADVTEDWLEITNVGTDPWVSGVDPDLFYDDEATNPPDPTVADPILGLTRIDPGESVVVVIGNAGDATDFVNVWTPVIDLTGVEVGFTDGAGLGQGGDAINLFVGGPTLETIVDTEAYPDTAGFSGLSYDVDLGAFSVAGQNGAVETLALGGLDDTEPAVGSPGNGEPITVMPTVDLVISEIMFNPASAEDDWEWVELYNAGDTVVDLSGFVLDDNNPVAVGAANIASGSIQPGETAVLYNADDVSDADFTAAWGSGINLVAVTGWSALGLNNSVDTVGLWDSFASYNGDNQTQANALVSVTYPNIGDGAGSVYLTDLTDQTSFALSTDGIATPAGGDAYTSRAAGGNNGSDIGSPGGFLSDVVAPTPSDPDLFQRIGGVTGLTGAEITAFDPTSNRLFIVDGSATLQVFDFSDQANPSLVDTIDVSGFGSAANSVAVSNGVVAIAIQANTVTDPGTVAFYEAAATGTLLDSTPVGALPDMLTFTPDGSQVLVANEGEPDGGIDPVGSISIIDFDGTSVTNVDDADFSGFDTATLQAAGVRIFSGKTAAEDLEPEYIAITEDGNTAFVTLQENNAVAVVDIANATVTEVRPLGLKDYSQPGNELDVSDADGLAGKLQTEPVFGLYQPDAIATFTIDGQTYTITADEGDARDEDARVADVMLDATVFPDAATLQEDANLGRLEISTIDGDTDNDGNFEQLVAYGGRSFTIRDASGTIVFESGNQLEAIGFANSDDPDGLDGRSDNKGPEPEGVTVGVIGDRTYAFVGLERANGTAVYDVTNPTAPTFVQYLATPGDVSPEGLTFIPASESPTGQDLLVVANEVSNSVSVYATTAPQTITSISEIQGESHVSPFMLADGQSVIDFFDTLPADTFSITGDDVVTQGVITAIDTNGFYLQDPNGDDNVATSDAIFVFTGSNNPILQQVSVNQSVQVAGTVAEFFPGDTDSRNLPTTQLVNPTVEVLTEPLGTVNATIVGQGGRIPPNQTIDDDAFATYEPLDDGIDFFESLEGMLVTAQDLVAVSGTSGFGEIFTVVDQGVDATGISQRGTLNISPDDFNPEKIQVDEDSGIFNFDFPEVNVGAQLGDVTGIVSYSFGNFEILPTEDFTAQIVDSALEAESTDLVGSADQLTVATYNVLNLDPVVEDPALTDQTDNRFDDDVDDDVGDGRFTTIAQQIVSNLNAPDIIGLQEVQDNTGAEIDDGVTSASDTLQLLIDEIAAAGGPTYAFIDNTFITEGASGGQPGGNIRTAFLYDPDRVGLVPNSVKTIGSQAPGEAFESGRLPLVADFEFNGQTVTVVNNHFSSKGGSAPILGIEQDFAARQEETDVNGSLDERQAQSQAVQDFVDTILANDPNANVAVLGDLNEFEFISPVEDLETDSGLTNLTNTLSEDERYTFNFQGNSQSLDHILVSDNLQAGAVVDIVHINSEFAATDQRASDHDPIVARFDLMQVGEPIDGTSGRDTLIGTDGDDIITGFGNRDTLTGGPGSDRFRYVSPVDAGDRITDFEVDGDVIDVSELLDAIGYMGSDPFGDGFIGVTSTRGNTVVTVDGDGFAGPGRAVGFITVDNVSVEQLNDESNFIL